MAWLRRLSPIGNGDSDDADFCPATSRDAIGQSRDARSSPRKKKAATAQRDAQNSSCDESRTTPKLVLKSAAKGEQRGKQIRLAPLNTTSVLRTAPRTISLVDSSLEPTTPTNRSRTPRKTILSAPRVEVKPDDSEAKAHGDHDDVSEAEAEENIWCGSDASSESSEDELPSIRKLLALKPPKKASVEPLPTKSSNSFEETLAATTTAVRKTALNHIASSRPGSSSDNDNQGAFLRFSPPRLFSPPRQRVPDRPQTPPQSPSKSRLQSPSKTRTRLPTPPGRPSLDAFWHADAVNDWNDQYSPQKVLKSPKKLKFLRDQEHSPSGSPKKCTSPSKAEREAKKTFELNKHALARAFLAELDHNITNDELQALSASTGGIHLIWSKTLNSTAGRANWRKETTKTTRPDGSTHTTYKHFASIELAEKVINDTDRLINVLTHEFCHLANFMISGVKDQPHGRQFKEWGRKCTKVFGGRGVEVTTKHTYQIEYKYVWQCSNEDCAVDFKRHSKSIDPKRHTCGSCRGRLVQVKPVPRNGGKSAGGGGVSGYAAFVKMHFAAVKRDLPGASHKEVMEAVGRKYRAEKGGVEVKEEVVDLDAVAKELEVVTLDDD